MHPTRWLATLALPFLASSAFAQTDWEAAPREPSFEVSGDTLRYAAVQEMADGRTWIEFDYALDTARQRYTFASNEPEGAGLVGLTVHVRSVIEFVDSDGSGRLDLGDDVVQRVPLAGLAGARMTGDALTPSGYEAVAFYPLPVGGDGSQLPLDEPPTNPGSLTLTFRFAPQREATTALLPTQVAYEARVAAFPYASNTSQLALELALVPIGAPASTPEAFTARSGSLEALHEWPTTAAVTLLETPDAPSNAQEAAAHAAFLAAPRSDDVRFASTFDVARDTPETVAAVTGEVLGHAGLFILGLALSGLLVGAVTWVRLRRP